MCDYDMVRRKTRWVPEWLWWLGCCLHKTGRWLQLPCERWWSEEP